MKGSLRAAAIGFAFHGPGLRLFTSFRMNRGLFRANLLALGLTFAAMGAAGVFAPAGLKGAAVFAAWVLGHLSWSFYLAAAVLREA